MVLIASKMGILGPQLQKIVVDVDNATLSTLEHTALYGGINSMMPATSSTYRKLGMFLAASIAYNLVVSKAQSSESSGTGR